MDALTWFKSVFRRALMTPAPLRADVDTEMWDDVPLHRVAARPARSITARCGDRTRSSRPAVLGTEGLDTDRNDSKLRVPHRRRRRRASGAHGPTA